ncbi:MULTISPECIES: CBS domain-containing protein [Zoogloea]|jgi:CBS-domain-containing membrane protein|uniref:CBS domain-containing protein n=1 Tax=Zoogloea TaxID=349 RepID=UPI00258C1BF6|nr:MULTISPECIES: CBS domain-containing protein [Zoogloea]MDD2669248.1 CBS domain-containing protein [Zoogloea sp.]MDY0037852.1 CBS domain-containing protein [Zoogloea oleivorans]
MERLYYQPITQFRVKSGSCEITDAWSLAKVTASSPAIEVMTDLRRIPAATIAHNVSLSETNHSMILRGVRLLFVTDASRRIVGIVTSNDLLGEKPTRVARERMMRHEELTVRDIMVSTEELDAVSLADVLRSEVGHVVATLKSCGRQHALVVEEGADGVPAVRGIFSASQIARQMGIPLQTTEVARTFAEIEAAIAS